VTGIISGVPSLTNTTLLVTAFVTRVLAMWCWFIGGLCLESAAATRWLL